MQVLRTVTHVLRGKVRWVRDIQQACMHTYRGESRGVQCMCNARNFRMPWIELNECEAELLHRWLRQCRTI